MYVDEHLKRNVAQRVPGTPTYRRFADNKGLRNDNSSLFAVISIADGVLPANPAPEVLLQFDLVSIFQFRSCRQAELSAILRL